MGFMLVTYLQSNLCIYKSMCFICLSYKDLLELGKNHPSRLIKLKKINRSSIEYLVQNIVSRCSYIM